MNKQVLVYSISILFISVFSIYQLKSIDKVKQKRCVFKTVFGEVELDKDLIHLPSADIQVAVEDGLDWLAYAQQTNGGWGAGFHRDQKQLDPHKVAADPATTAMVSMALLRTGSTLEEGPYHVQLKKATDYILNSLDENKAEPSTIKTHKRNSMYGYGNSLSGGQTQIQRKLGQNIDVVMSTQFLNNLLDKLDKQDPYVAKVNKGLERGVLMVQNAMDEDGRTKNAGWAGVLQSAYATSALESASMNGVAIDEVKLEKAKAYQRRNYDPISESADTKDGAGIMLYSVTSSARSNAVEARKAKEALQVAYDNGEITEEENEVSFDNLKKIGIEDHEALKLNTAYDVYESAKVKSQDQEVMSGFGNNGGEEFLSFLQTGESLMVNRDNSWKQWYDNISSTIMNIQNQDGSWNGHHCITSPVFCTATCIMILSINNDIETLMK